MIRKLKTCLIVLSLSPISVHALVDYTESQVSSRQAAPVRTSAPAPRVSKMTKRAPVRSSGVGYTPTGAIEFDTSYESLKVHSGDREGKVKFYHFHGNIQTPYDVYLDVSHWLAASSDDFLAKTGDYQSGNPTVKLGFNWLQFGNTGEQITVDFVAGVTLGKKNSDFASSRTDKSFGLETAKQFHSFILALGYELRLTGTPDDLNETKIGNIQHLSSALGWVVSNDIKFMLAGDYYMLSATESNDGRAFVGEDLSFGSVGPSVLLEISPLVELQMGARFRTKRVDNDKLLGAKVYDLKGLYGTSIFAGLNFAI